MKNVNEDMTDNNWIYKSHLMGPEQEMFSYV